MKRVKLLSLIMVFILVFSMAAFASEASTSKTVYIIHTNDVHSRVTDSAGMGYAKVAGLAASIKTEKVQNHSLMQAMLCTDRQLPPLSRRKHSKYHE